MPKQAYKILQFHGGLNSNSDPRDLMENELSDLVDVMVDEFGKIRMMGGVTGHVAGTPEDDQETGWEASLDDPGHGLFYFSHDRLGAEDADDNKSATGNDYLAMYDDSDRNIFIYSEKGDVWDDDVDSPDSGVIDLGATGGADTVFYIVDGALRVADGNFGANNRVKWYGYVKRRFFGDNATGYDAYGSSNNGLLIDEWRAENAAPTALAVGDFTGGVTTAVTDTTNDNPVSVHIRTVTDSLQVDLGGHATVDTQTLACSVDFTTTNPKITADATGGGILAPGFDTFCSVGDHLMIYGSSGNNNDEIIYVVTAVSGAATNTISVSGTVTAGINDAVHIMNLSRSDWYNPDSTGMECAVSTLYDDSKQETELSVCSNVVEWKDVVNSQSNWGELIIDILVRAGDGSSDGVPIATPRVSGFHIYMRHQGTETWYLQAIVDVSFGIKGIADETYSMWKATDHSYDDETATCQLNGQKIFHKAITFEDSSGFNAASKFVGFDGVGVGYKTAAISNRIAYVGNVSIQSGTGFYKKLPDAILKSFVNKFDSFVEDRRIEVSINDGDEIIKLLIYADRLFEFKKNKVSIINISQEVEFLEETLMHKGIPSSTAACLTDMGIAWANEQGAYFYDGQKVDNLLEKGGRQIISESIWATFITTAPVVAYIPKKRQILVADNITTAGDGSIYLYDLVTQSWTKGSAGTITNQIKTNFVTDWNNDLIYAHTGGDVVKWDDASNSSAHMVIMSKDIDFGEPAVRKKIYKVYITYRGNASNVQVHYGKDGLAPTLTFNTINSDGSTTGSGSLAKSMPIDAGVTDWLKAELKPSASVNNISSFRLKLSGDGSAAVHADFEINDITIIYRIKGVK